MVPFADDVHLIEKTTKQENKAEKMGLLINEHMNNKTEYMFTSRNYRNRDRIGQNVSSSDYNFQHFSEFKYLGTAITEDNNGSEETS